MKARRPRRNATWDFVTALLFFGLLLLVLGLAVRHGASGKLVLPVVLVIAILGMVNSILTIIADRQSQYPEGERRTPAWRIIVLIVLLVVALASPWWVSYVIH